MALRGSGQGLYVGLSDEAYVIASEPYGLVEATDSYLRLNGETLPNRNDSVSGPGRSSRSRSMNLLRYSHSNVSPMTEHLSQLKTMSSHKLKLQREILTEEISHIFS